MSQFLNFLSSRTVSVITGLKMIGGFALVAFPAEYHNSGVMTFMVSHNGTVYEKDLGPDTDEDR